MSAPDDKHLETAHELMIVAGAEYFNTYYDEGEPGELFENGLVYCLAPHIAAALSHAHAEGRKDTVREALSIVAQCASGNDWSAAHVAARIAIAIYRLEHQSVGGDYSHVVGAYAGTASDENPATNHQSSVATSSPRQGDAGEVEPSRASPATHSSERSE